MDETIDAAGLLEVLRRRPRESRTIVAIAGAPGSGKSTLAEALVDGLNARDPGRAALLPMDGFHFDDRVLDALGRRARKGAPDTFDVGGLDHALARLGARDEAFVAVPVFDRGIEIARAGARLIPAETPVIVAEGNYLLLAEPPGTASPGISTLRCGSTFPRMCCARGSPGAGRATGCRPRTSPASWRRTTSPTGGLSLRVAGRRILSSHRAYGSRSESSGPSCALFGEIMTKSIKVQTPT